MAKDLSKSVADLEKDVEDLFKKIVTVAKDAEAHGKGLDDFEEAIKENGDQIKNVEDRLESAIKQQSTDLQLLGKKLDTTNYTTEVLLKQLDTKAREDHVYGRIEYLEKELNGRIDKLDDSIEALQKQLEKIDEGFDALSKEVDATKASIATLEKYNEDHVESKRLRNELKDRIASMEKAFDKYQEDYPHADMKDMRSHIEKLERELKKAR